MCALHLCTVLHLWSDLLHPPPRLGNRQGHKQPINTKDLTTLH